jgi:hypothetical protein
MEKQFVIVRTRSAGVHAGALESYDKQVRESILSGARRLWYWDGAASLSQLAMEGTKKPNTCKFPCIVKKVILPETIEILETTQEAQNSILDVPIWEE